MLILVAVTGLSCTWMALADPLNPLVLFTVQSNLMLAGYCSWRVVTRRRPSTGVKGGDALHRDNRAGVALSAHAWSQPLRAPLSLTGPGLGNFLLHYVTPIMAVIDWLAFDRTAPRPRWAAAPAWLAYPVVYMVFALVRGALLPPHAWKRYPYPFLNVDRFGYGGVLLMAVALAVCFALLGYGLIALHRLVNHRNRTAVDSM
ncbi:Pr6Pr family membrane protein [Nonomuraea dietziae]|uniref:Pr6Pr family membrane protein n=1 Tax=Nonomuraea dietziae TaxID=65515 RepID=UPI0036186E02